jgi:ribosomal-protein-alanine N-acetyltransferase
MVNIGIYQISVLCELEHLCYPETMAYDICTMENFLREPGTLLLCEWRRGRLAGFQLSDRIRGTIITIDIHPDYRRLGIARRLMHRTLQILKMAGIKNVMSQVAVNNAPSLMLHLKFGFKQRQRIRHYYQTGEDAYLFVLDL